MKNTIYPEIIDKVLDACDLYTKNKITSRHLQHIIYWAEQSVTSLEEKELRVFFTRMEGELDSVRSLASGINIDQQEEVEDRDEILKIITKIISSLTDSALTPNPEGPPDIGDITDF